VVDIEADEDNGAGKEILWLILKQMRKIKMPPYDFVNLAGWIVKK
jgi:hypothetical protein